MGQDICPFRRDIPGHSRLSRWRLWPLVVSTVGRAGLWPRVLFIVGFCWRCNPHMGGNPRKASRMLG